MKIFKEKEKLPAINEQNCQNTKVKTNVCNLANILTEGTKILHEHCLLIYIFIHLCGLVQLGFPPRNVDTGLIQNTVFQSLELQGNRGGTGKSRQNS